MDSVTMLHEYRDSIAAAVTFQYGSNHNKREARCARINCEKLGIEWIEIDLSFMGRHFESSLLQGADAIPEGHYADDNMRSTVVPFRNGIMLAVAAGLAESRKLDGVMIANHSGDHAIYPDCRPDFIASMGRAIADGTYDHLQLLAPTLRCPRARLPYAARTSELTIRSHIHATKAESTTAANAALVWSAPRHSDMQA